MRFKPFTCLLFIAALLPRPLLAQEAVPADEPALVVEGGAEAFDTSYEPAAWVTYRVKRTFLDGVFRSAGADARAKFQAQFDARSHELIWQDLVEKYGLRTGNVADAMAAYWMLNWIVANGAFDTDIAAGPVRRQLTVALANDPSFATLRNDQRQEMAERLMLDFLVLHAALNTAMRNQDLPTLQALAREAVVSFRQQYRVDLLALVPGPEGLAPKPPEPAGEEPAEEGAGEPASTP